MKIGRIKFALYMFIAMACVYNIDYAQNIDTRNIKTGYSIPSENYCDQPYVVKTTDGAWLCVITTGRGNEGDFGQHIVSQRSYDQGKTWVDKVDVEPADGPEASYAVMLKAPNGRIFVFYNHNTDNTRKLRADNPPFTTGFWKRADSQGHFVFKYSDDNGKTWSAKRFEISVRSFPIDKNNAYQGSIRFFWNVGRAFIYKGSAYVPLIKVGGFGEGGFTSSEGVLLRSDNLFSVTNMDEASWITLPEGDKGLQTPPGGGPIAEEQSYSTLSDGSFFSVYRTIDGYPACTYSRDGGRTWNQPQYMQFANGQLMKHPRAANFVWRCENGKYLYWFHNHGGRFIKEHPDRRNMAFRDRNPVWLAAGIEQDSKEGKIIKWSQPEILLYDDDPLVGMSYPDLIEENGSYYITETQKHIARLHKINNALLEGLWRQFDNHDKTKNGLLLNWVNDKKQVPSEIAAVVLPEFYIRNQQYGYTGAIPTGGFTIDIAFKFNNPKEGQILLDNRNASQVGWVLRINDQKALELIINDGQTQASWACDQSLLSTNTDHYVSIIVDGGPKVISYVVDGILDDGGDSRQFGWGRFSPFLKSANGSHQIKIGYDFSGIIKGFSLYNRAISTSEAIGNYRFYKTNIDAKN